MNVQKLAQVAGLSCLLLLAGSVSAKAMMIAPAPLSQRLATADCVVIGKVTSIEDKLVAAPRFLNDKEKGEYKVAIVKIEEGFGSARKLTHIKVGFLPTPTPGVNPGTGPGPIIRPIRRYPSVQLEKGQEVCLFLQPHFQASFSIAQGPYDGIIKDKNNAANFEKDVAEVKRCAKLLADPKAGLQAKNADDRLVTASMLIAHYRTPKPFAANPKQEPIDAEQSKLILKTLAEANWDNKNTGPLMWQMNPQNLFFRLGLTEQDGWSIPKNEKQQQDYRLVPEAARAWLNKNADTYRIKRFVAEEKKAEK